MTNPKVRREQAIAGVLLLVFAVILANSLKQLGVFGRPAAATSKGAAAVEFGIPKSLAKVANNYLNRFEAKIKKIDELEHSPVIARGAVRQGPAYTAQNLRDPLVSLLPKPKLPEQKPRPAIEAAKEVPLKLPELVVNGLVWGGSNPQAVINGKLYSVGEAVEGATLTAIAADGVTLEFHGQIIRLGIINSLGAEVPAARPYQYSRR